MKRHMRGITLIELLVFIIIVTAGLLGTLAVFGPSVRGSADPLIRKQALNLAESMLREVMQKAYQNDPSDPGNTSNTLGCTVNTNPACPLNSVVARPNYNDVDDYNTYNQAVVGLNGAAIAGLAACVQQVAVAAGAWNGVNGKFVTVTATCADQTVALTAFRGNF